jgi:tRNA U34 5-methylaminomethyl-2-thiouridine-forming methyltransferase MnmC
MKSRFQIITNPNGTHTLRDTVVGQEMHSRVGPWIEAKTLYAEGSKIAEKLAQRGNLVLHDVGMGTSANVIASLEAIEGSNFLFAKGTQLSVESFETEPSGLEYALTRLDLFPLLEPYQDQLQILLEKKSVTFTLPRSAVQVQWRLFNEDYFQALNGAKKPTIIFYDFYSQKAEPNLWSEGTFKTLRTHLDQDPCELYTYSAATPVRLSLLFAGFYVGHGASTEMKTETTVAATHLNLLDSPLESRWIEKLKISSSIQDEDLRRRGVLFLEQYFRKS